jgi:DNA-binding transcriptional ArsR family regulator
MPPRARRPLRPNRVRVARTRLLAGPSASLVEQVCEVFCEPTRAQIVRVLSAGALSVTDLAIATERSRSAISQHLRILREDGIVQRRRRGRLAYYALTTALVVRSSLLALDAVASAASA